MPTQEKKLPLERIVLLTLTGLVIAWLYDNAYPLPPPVVADNSSGIVRPVTVPGIGQIGRNNNPLGLRPTPVNPGWQSVRRVLDEFGNVVSSSVDFAICSVDRANAENNPKHHVDPECK